MLTPSPRHSDQPPFCNRRLHKVVAVPEHWPPPVAVEIVQATAGADGGGSPRIVVGGLAPGNMRMRMVWI